MSTQTHDPNRATGERDDPQPDVVQPPEQGDDTQPIEGVDDDDQ